MELVNRLRKHAKLHAAAPELLKALQSIVNDAPDSWSANVAREAIAKAQ
jgi:hypothetical protein